MVYETDGEERLVTGHTGRLFLLLTVILVCLQLTQRILPPLLPAIIDDLSITAFLAGVALTSFRIARASMEYPSGRFADQLSRTTVLLTCVSVVIVGVLVLSIATNYLIFLIGVVLFGVGFGLYSPASRALLSDVFVEKRGRAFGLHMMGGDISGVLAAGIAVVVLAIGTWRGAFLPLSVLLFILLIAFYVYSREPIRIERVELGVRHTAGRLIKNPTLRWVLVVYALFVMASSGVISFLPTFLIEVHGFSFEFASVAFALVYGIGIFSKPLSGYLSDVLPRPPVAGGSLLIAGFGLGLLILAPLGGIVLGGVIIFAFGQRGVPPALQAFLMDRFPDGSMGGDLGAMRTFYTGVGSLGPTYVGYVAGLESYGAAFAGLIVCMLASAGLIASYESLH
jgi:predicted MFS family arabinose efflux permease